MKKQSRTGKVFVDWSQNDEHKTTVAVYSLRSAREAHRVLHTSHVGMKWSGRSRRRMRACSYSRPAQVSSSLQKKMGRPVQRRCSELKQRLPDRLKSGRCRRWRAEPRAVFDRCSGRRRIGRKASPSNLPLRKSTKPCNDAQGATQGIIPCAANFVARLFHVLNFLSALRDGRMQRWKPDTSIPQSSRRRNSSVITRRNSIPVRVSSLFANWSKNRRFITGLSKHLRTSVLE